MESRRWVFGILRKSGAERGEDLPPCSAGGGSAQSGVCPEEPWHQPGGSFHTDIDYIEQSVDLVINNLLIGAVLASLVLMMFLRSIRSVLVVAISIPISLITVFILLRAFGRSLNIISLAGLAFSVGMLVVTPSWSWKILYRHIAWARKARLKRPTRAREFWRDADQHPDDAGVYIPIVFFRKRPGSFSRTSPLPSLPIALSFITSPDRDSHGQVLVVFACRAYVSASSGCIPRPLE